MSHETFRDELIAECLEEHHRRRARGEPATLDAFDARLRDDERAELERLIATESALDALIEPPELVLLPRAFGAYTLLRELGRGAMGIVYEAVHRSLGRNVALKVLRGGIDLDPDARLRFQREARACAQVRHDHIVEIYEAGEFDGQPYYAMELVDGRTLSELSRAGELPETKDLLERLADVADALDALHGAGIVHRDVKPSNIIMDARGRLILADFGLARSLDAERLTLTGQALGTPAYMSPEQVALRGRTLDGRCDVYALGVSLYELLGGRGPFEDEDPMAVLRMILKEQPDPLQQVAPGVPADACRIVMKAIEKEPDDRYASAAEMRDDLRAFVAGRRVEGRPVSPARRLLRRARAQWVPLSAAAVVVAVGAYAFSHRPGSISVNTIPAAEVVLDGTSHGLAPLTDLSLAPGTYTLELVADGWSLPPREITVAAGERRDFTIGLIAEDPDDVDALRVLGEQVGVALADLNPSRSRAKGGEETVIATFPRGRVRLGDLDALRVDVTDSYEPGGRVVFVRAGEEIGTLAFEPERMVTTLEFPADVRDRLSVGDSIEWGYVAPSGARHTASFEVVDEATVARTLRAIDTQLADQRPAIRAQLAIQALLDAGLDYAAYVRASEVAGRRAESTRTWTVMEASLGRLGLQGTRPWVEAAKGRDAALERAPR